MSAAKAARRIRISPTKVLFLSCSEPSTIVLCQLASREINLLDRTEMTYWTVKHGHKLGELSLLLGSCHGENVFGCMIE